MPFHFNFGFNSILHYGWFYFLAQAEEVSLPLPPPPSSQSILNDFFCHLSSDTEETDRF